MTGKIALQEHFALPETLRDSERYFTPDAWQRMYGALTGFHEKRLAEMDQYGIRSEFARDSGYLRHSAGESKLPAARTTSLAAQIAQNPARFQGLRMSESASRSKTWPFGGYEVTMCTHHVLYCVDIFFKPRPAPDADKPFQFAGHDGLTSTGRAATPLTFSNACAIC